MSFDIRDLSFFTPPFQVIVTVSGFLVLPSFLLGRFRTRAPFLSIPTIEIVSFILTSEIDPRYPPLSYCR